MFRVRSLLTGGVHAKRILGMVPSPLHVPKQLDHDHGAPRPFENMPFKIRNRFLTTVVFSIFFGLGLWAPFIIVWYSMAKRTL